MQIRGLLVLLAVTASTTTYADPSGPCTALCRKISDCRIAAFSNTCVDTCKQKGGEATPDNRAKAMNWARSTCAQLKDQMGDATTRMLAMANRYLAESKALDDDLDNAERNLPNDERDVRNDDRTVRASAPARNRGSAHDSQWLCAAAGQSGVNRGVYTSYRNSNVLYGKGNTRAAAAAKALADCNAVQTFDLGQNASEVEPDSIAGITSPCHITQCMGPH